MLDIFARTFMTATRSDLPERADPRRYRAAPGGLRRRLRAVRRFF